MGRKPNGTIWLYANNILRDNGRPYAQGEQIGHGWNAFNIIM